MRVKDSDSKQNYKFKDINNETNIFNSQKKFKFLLSKMKPLKKVFVHCLIWILISVVFCTLITISLTTKELCVIFISVPCLSVMTLDLHNERKTLFGNMNSYGHIHQQTLFCGKYHRLGHHPSVPAAAVILLPSSLPAPYTFRTVDEVFCKENKWEKNWFPDDLKKIATTIYR